MAKKDNQDVKAERKPLEFIQLNNGGHIIRLTNEKNENLKDLSWREIVTLVPLLVMIFWIGLYPKPFFDLIGPSVEALVATLGL